MTATITNASAVLLKNALTAPSWAETIPAIFTAGEIITKKLTLEDLDAENKEWMAQKKEYDLSAQEVSVIKTCFDALAAAKSLPVNEYTMELIVQLGLNPS